MTRRAFLTDLFDTLVLIDGEVYARGRRAMAERLGVCDFDFLTAWRATAHAAQTGELRTTEARCIETMRHLQKGHDPHLAGALARQDVEWLLRASRPYPGAEEFLADLRRRFPGGLVLVSNAAANARDLLRHLGWLERFDALVLSCEVGALKPAAPIYRAGLTAARAADGWFLGDGASGELEGARAAGLAPLRIDHPLKFDLLRGAPVVDPLIPVCASFDAVLARLDAA